MSKRYEGNGSSYPRAAGNGSQLPQAVISRNCINASLVVKNEEIKVARANSNLSLVYKAPRGNDPQILSGEFCWEVIENTTRSKTNPYVLSCLNTLYVEKQPGGTPEEEFKKMKKALRRRLRGMGYASNTYAHADKFTEQPVLYVSGNIATLNTSNGRIHAGQPIYQTLPDFDYNGRVMNVDGLNSNPSRRVSVTKTSPEFLDGEEAHQLLVTPLMMDMLWNYHLVITFFEKKVDDIAAKEAWIKEKKASFGLSKDVAETQPGGRNTFAKYLPNMMTSIQKVANLITQMSPSIYTGVALEDANPGELFQQAVVPSMTNYR